MKEDTLFKRYLSDDTRYADLINGIEFAGEQVVHPEDLTDRDTQSGYHSARDGKNKSPKVRDLIRKCAFGVNFAVVGVENQTQVHFLMPLRVMGYDLREYERQADEVRKVVKDSKNISREEFLSGFLQNGRLHPCISLVLFYGEEWTGSRSLHELLDFSQMPEHFRRLVADYPLNLIEIRKLKHTEVFRTDLKQVFDFIRFSSDKEQLRELVTKDPSYAELNEDAYDVIAQLTKAEELAAIKQFHEKEGKVNMCVALKEMLKDEREEGLKEGIKEGQNKINELVKHLILDGRDGDVLRAVSEEEYRNRLLADYGLE